MNKFSVDQKFKFSIPDYDELRLDGENENDNQANLLKSDLNNTNNKLEFIN